MEADVPRQAVFRRSARARGGLIRIASLIASSTEIVCALGLEDALVARSHECDHPSSVGRLPAVTAPKLDVGASSAAIDAAVKRLVRDAASVYTVDGARLKELKPDVILTQTQCEVCAVSRKDVEKALAGELGFPTNVVSLEPNRLEDVWTDIQRVADACGAGEAGRELVARLRERMQSISGKASLAERKPTVACIEWLEPVMAAGNWVPELVTLAGGVNLFGEAGKHSPWMTFDELKAKDPDVILLMPCGFDIGRTRKEAQRLNDAPAWKELRASRENRTMICDGNQFFNRPGPRLLESLEILAEILHPGLFSFGHQGKGWERL